MRKILIVIIVMVTVAEFSTAQNVNWKSLNPEKQNIAYLNFGYDYGLTAQLGYSRSINTFKPVLLGLDYSFPMGENLVDDHKVRYGGQIELIEMKDFSLSAKVMGNYKRYEDDMVRIANFGTELSVLAGYYRPKWHIAAEFGFDKSIISHLKHSEIIKEYLPSITDGWYDGSGGKYFYGIQASKSIGTSMDLSIRLGATKAPKDHDEALIARYAQIGFSKSF